MTKHIPLTRGRVASVDDLDYRRLSVHRWCVSGRYAATRINGKMVYMHRFILDAPRGMNIDHIDGDVFNNQRSNLRLATQKQNSRNQKCKPGRFKGVYHRKDTGKWSSYITVDGQKISLGCFTNEEIAAVAYDVAARIYFGEFAHTNFDWSKQHEAD